MSGKLLKVVAILCFLATSCVASPVELLNVESKAHILFGKFIEIARSRLSNQSATDIDSIRASLTKLFLAESDPQIIIRTCHHLLGTNSEAGDQLIAEVFDEAWMHCIWRVSELNTQEALHELQIYQALTRLDGGYSLTVKEAIARMEQNLLKLK